MRKCLSVLFALVLVLPLVVVATLFAGPAAIADGGISEIPWDVSDESIAA